MDFKEISINQLMDEIITNKSVFLCGNGFSVNFDESYKLDNLAKTLYQTHCHLKSNKSYDMISKQPFKRICKENFNQTIKILDKIYNENDFNNLFESAVLFAQSILSSKITIDWLKNHTYNNTLTFGLSSLDLVESIIYQASTYGIMQVNYELWSVLIYFILALKSAPKDIYVHDKDNLFVQATLKGTSQAVLETDSDFANLYADTAINGMYTYLRFLFTTNILLEGKSFNVQELSRWSHYDLNLLVSFFNNYNYIITTNYDLLLEKISNRNDIAHLHGSFSKIKKRVLAQSLGVFYNFTRYDLSTLIFGDYFLSKSFYQTTAKIANKNPQNTKIEIYTDILERIVQQKNTQSIVIFGLNVDNDYHIISNIKFHLALNKCTTNKLIYCYYSEKDKESFLKIYYKIIFSSTVNAIIKSKIQVQLISSKELLDNFFIPLT